MRAQAILNGDVATLREITGDGYVHVDGSGSLRNKEEFLASFSGAHAHYTRYSIADNVISVHAEVAIVTGRFENEHVTSTGAKSNIAHQGTEIKA